MAECTAHVRFPEQSGHRKSFLLPIFPRAIGAHDIAARLAVRVTDKVPSCRTAISTSVFRAPLVARHLILFFSERRQSSEQHTRRES